MSLWPFILQIIVLISSSEKGKRVQTIKYIVDYVFGRIIWTNNV